LPAKRWKTGCHWGREQELPLSSMQHL